MPNESDPDGQPAHAAAGSASASRRGRPRQPETDAAILDATIQLLTEVGIAGTTTNAIAARSGCSKATLYRRWPSRDALILDALRLSVQGRPSDIRQVVDLEEELGSMLHAAACRSAAIFDSKVFRAVFPTIARELLTETSLGRQFVAEVFQPIRSAARERFRSAAARERLDPDVDVDLVLDLVFGSVLYRVLLEQPMTDDVLEGIGELATRAARPAAPRDQVVSRQSRGTG